MLFWKFPQGRPPPTNINNVNKRAFAFRKCLSVTAHKLHHRQLEVGQMLIWVHDILNSDSIWTSRACILRFDLDYFAIPTIKSQNSQKTLQALRVELLARILCVRFPFSLMFVPPLTTQRVFLAKLKIVIEAHAINEFGGSMLDLTIT